MRLTAIEEGHLRNGMPGTIGIAAVFPGGPFDLAQVRSRVRDRWGGLDRMSLVLQPPSGPAALSGHRWSAARPFDPAAHITATDQDLESLLTDGVSHRLPAERPLWRLLVTRQAIVLLAHHALLDGRSLETLFRLLMDDAVPPGPLGQGAAHPLARGRQRPAVGPAAVCGELRRIAVLGQPLPPAPLGEPRPSVAVVELDPQVMRTARRQPVDGRGSTLNELLLSTYAGALRACHGPLRSWPKGPTPFYATVPVDLRTRDNAHHLGNGVTALRMALPVDLESPVARLRACQDEVVAFDGRCDAHRAILPPLVAIARTVPWLAGVMAKRLARPELTTSLCTAFKWRDNPSHLHGRPLARIVPLPQLSPPGTANLCLVHTADAYTLTVVSHLRGGDAGTIGEAVERELKAVAASDPF
ncbi:wax ester/triacylglycerol synthase family O-acyltransferase [Streptomyces sp. DT2A-34]|uniref:wax ester/triacylglycerol synthase domain-containing protein n=1 Tax=Streptomyces sp. DT2A-34 TaxID=3051182 RepID=UPI00265C7D7E|nr:wax ester/triacylglycerol synthase domain-containing protein [Streptomyces sp. DT2A-34]MDO0913860.1 wax ester/triacylglycerol synthase family O-acyltransferase [Streptomyces sp. DT2A-34]